MFSAHDAASVHARERVCTHVSELGGSVRCVLVVHVCLDEPEDKPEVTEKSHELLLARKSNGAEGGDLLSVLQVARLNQHNLVAFVHACHTLWR